SKDAATRRLEVLHQQLPDDRVVTELLLMIAGPEAVGAPPSARAPEKPGPGVAAADLVGKWSATGEEQTRFTLELTKEGTFVWNYAKGKKSETVEGVYALDGNVLALEPQTGGVMLAQVTQPEGGQFDFQ